ncbi:DDE-type integrase/transposase/recombinase [Tenacibaculum mesophilum]|uniref:DDE-type integrase/transposase/recombinase n=1 Tax=Tenacibaculum mesophilum TaxID=104268 RepID=A0AAE9SFD8_9FLAO|nr:Mu transposase C-terminal domain-containing protein [Tenacibaculum mesophilum]UTD15417.1 DDE-type integrase/transposase/recombinase [Tenacibaculum mesophilum]
MDRLKIDIGEKVLYKQKEAVIIKLVDLNRVTVQELKNNIIHTVKINSLKPFLNSSSDYPEYEIALLTDEKWEEAQRRFKIILPILENRRDSNLVKKIASENGVHYTTLYRWVKIYDKTNLVSSLIGFKKNGGKGKSRLNLEIDTIIKEAINDIYLDSSKKSITKVIREITKRCKEKELKPPHSNTIRNRIKSLSEEEVLRKRYGKSKARDKFEPIKSSFPGADYPLSVVQIDHTKVDVVLVDEHYRKPFLRPWLTLAMDVYSRMVVGFYLSFDPPGEMGTGLCIANSILPKDMWVEKKGIEADWPCWGIMNTIHVDNAREFRGKMLRRACQNYGINLEYRPVAKPNWGGHVERLLGTFSKEIHNLSGTTFSDPKDRENYNSEKNASFTISEFEKWLMIYILNVYHKKQHSSIGMSPEQRYNEGIFGGVGKDGSGLPPMLMNERRIKLDFMPYVERTVQEYGVVIEHITYYDEVLRRYIHAKEEKGRGSVKKKFMFRRDPRDISVIYFYDPELNEYYEIPYRDTSKPAISIWEYREVVRLLSENRIEINEEAIFNAYERMDEIEMKAIRDTKRLKRTSRYSDKRNLVKEINEVEETNKVKTEEIPIVEPFEELDDESFT